MLNKAEILKGMLEKVEKGMIESESAKKGLFAPVNILDIDNADKFCAENQRYLIAMNVKKAELSIRSLIEIFEKNKNAKDFFALNTSTLSLIEENLGIIIKVARYLSSTCSVSVETLMDWPLEITKCKNKKKYMITRMSIINRLKKEEFRAIYTEDEKPCEDAFLDNIIDCCGEECTRYFVILNNDAKAFEELRAKTGTTVMLTENTTFNCPELVLFDENLDEDYYLS